MAELLSPAGGWDSLVAAVQSGADAVYMGFGAYNARRSAKNFTEEEFSQAVRYCHLRGVRVYLTLNTLLTDRELSGAAELLHKASRLGVDAVLIQDWGVWQLARQAAPELPLHASTQMSLHTLGGARRAAELGLTRVVLARELSRRDIAAICRDCPAEVEVFAHGALCMCYSGQCALSAVIGGRSGNRGTCAQPCRLPYGVNAPAAGGHPLSLKDANLSPYLQELEDMGVACLKLEGRMKRPEYVAVITSIYRRLLDEKRRPTREEQRQLELAFSRSGFTDGYYLGQKGPQMFGTRPENLPEPKELFAEARTLYEKEDRRTVAVDMDCVCRAGEPVRLTVRAGDQRAEVTGPVPETARNRALTAEELQARLKKTGGTAFRCREVRVTLEEGLMLSAGAVNALRREALEKLSVQRQEPPRRRTGEYHAGARYENRREEPVLTISVRRAEQLTDELLRLRPALVYVPLDELAAHPEKAAGTEHTSIGVSLPRVAWDREYPGLREKLEQVRALGVKDALLGNLGMFPIARELGFTLRGDFGLEIYNAQALKEYKRLGLQSATLSFELKLAQIRDLSKCLDTELITYGRLPLMLMENCIIRNRTGSCGCQNTNILTDRKGARFPVVSAPGCRNELLNSQKLFLADRAADYRRIGLWAQRLLFTTENPRECVQVAQRYLEQGSWTPNEYTRGLYYRDVE